MYFVLVRMLLLAEHRSLTAVKSVVHIQRRWMLFAAAAMGEKKTDS